MAEAEGLPTVKELDELGTDKVRKAMALLVKHRGGGPFGGGRLDTAEEVQALEDSLLDAMATFRDADFNGLDPGTGQPGSAPPAATLAAKQAAGGKERTEAEQEQMEAHATFGGNSGAASTYMEQLNKARAAKAAKQAS